VQLYLAVTPDKLREAARYTDRLAHVAYRVGQDGRLVRRDLLARTRGGLMVLGDQDCGPIRDPAALCRDVWRECGNRGYGGVFADFEQPVSADRTAFLEALGRILARNGRSLFIPETYGTQAVEASILICTALSGGNLYQRLEESLRQFGRGRVALDLQRLRMSFPLPCPTGEGEPLSRETLAEMMKKKQQSVFYSHDLCAKYFTITDAEESRFVLFDDADTIRRKLRIGQELGITAGFLMYPEVYDLLPELLGQRR
jgi:hypothetical protein